jgi:hypothetical protein
MSNWTDAIPEKMKDLALDHRRKVPVPLMNVLPDGDTYDFRVVSNSTVMECGRDHLCGICGKPLEYWIAFVGGPVSLKNGAYSDPPFHKECALAAMRFCPHINRKVHRRTSDEKMPDGTFYSELAVTEKPAQWIIGLTRSYRMIRHNQGVLFLAASMPHTIRFEYDEDGHLQEVAHD